MEAIVPLDLFCEKIKPFYYVKGNGRQPTPLKLILKMYLVSQWYSLSDEATEDLLYENQAAKNYVGVDCNTVPDETTLCKFRHLLERNNLAEEIFNAIAQRLENKGVLLKTGTIIDATIIDAPKSEKNKKKQRDPEMGSTFKNNQHFFGMKAHIGVDSDSGLVHSVAVTAANVSDIGMAHAVLHGEEELVRGDAGYIGIEKRKEICEKYQDGTKRTEAQKPSHGKKRPDTYIKRDEVEFKISKKRKTVITDEDKETERQKSSVRAKVEHIFQIIKHIFRFRKTRYRGIAKNTTKMLMLFALANILRCSQKKLSTI